MTPRQAKRALYALHNQRARNEPGGMDGVRLASWEAESLAVLGWHLQGMAIDRLPPNDRFYDTPSNRLLPEPSR